MKRHFSREDKTPKGKALISIEHGTALLKVDTEKFKEVARNGLAIATEQFDEAFDENNSQLDLYQQQMTQAQLIVDMAEMIAEPSFEATNEFLSEILELNNEHRNAQALKET